MSRSRRAAGSWPTREPEIAEPEPRWASLTDTGSMAPSDEALTWQRRADDWAQQAEIEPYQGGGGHAVEPANRWSSEVTPTGRPTFPADGVGWRTETAEWRATGARWRQTTEWRSATGSHVWRSTTETWQDEEERRAAAEREKPSIPGTAWPTPEPEAETPSWRRSDPDTSSSWRQSDPDTSSSWRRTDAPAVTSPVEQTWSKSTPSWQQPSAQTPSWQQPQQPQTPSWQQPSAPAPSWQQPQQQTPSWQQPSTQTPSWQEPQQTPSWQQPSTQLPSRRRGAETGAPSWTRSDNPPPGENTTGVPRWERTEAPGWQRSAAEDARHLVREDDRAAWRRESGPTERPTRVGRRRAAETGAAPAGGTGWTNGADTDNWAGHTDTGSIPVVSDQALSPDATTWGTRSAPPSRRERGRYAEPPPPPPEQPPAPRSQPEPRPGKPRYNANATNWREDTASWDAEQDTSNWTRDPDTGQWSRGEEDPRVLAWRAEAARREAMKKDEPAGDGGRRPRRAEPAGGVPGGPLPSSSVPDPSEAGATWPTSAMPGSRPRSALPGPMSPVDDTQAGRRRRVEEPPYPTGSTGRRRAAEPPVDEPIGPEARRAPQDPRREPDDYPPPGGRPGPRPPQWSDPGGQAPRRSAYRDEPYGGRRELPAGSSGPSYPAPGPGYPQRSEPSYPQQSGPSWSEPSRPEPSRPEPPSWSEPSRPEPPSWSDPSWSVQEQPQRGLPPRGGAPQQRPAYGTPAGALPAGPSAPEQPTYGGAPRELPPGRSGYGSPASAPTSSGLSWLEQERQRLQEPQGPAYGGGTSWLEQERQRSASAPTSSGPAWLDQERQRSASAPTSSGPAWLEQERQRSASAPTSSGPAWLEQERQRPAPQQGPAYGSARALPAGSDAGPRWTDPAASGGPRALPAGGGTPSWSEQQKPAYGGGDLSGRWPDPLADQSGRGGYGDQGAGGGFGERPPMADWLAAERANRRGADYRGSAGQDGETDWRQELSRQNDLAEGESRRYDTSDFPPFRPSGSATVAGASNLALSATSVISTAPGGAAPTGEDTSWPPRRSTGAFQGTGSYERRPMSGDLLAGPSPDLLNPDDDEEEEKVSSPLAAVGYTVVWYGVPVVLFVLAMFLLNSGQRSTALDTLAGAAPEFGIALVLSMLVAFGLRSATTAWKSPSIGLAAAVVGGGLATVLSSAITGNSLS